MENSLQVDDLETRIQKNNNKHHLDNKKILETNSITKIKGAKTKGTPEGKKRLTKPQFLFHTHIKFM